MRRIVFFTILIGLNVLSCKSPKSVKNEVNVHLLSDPDRLMPYVSNSADATALERFLFQKLITWDYEKNELVGELAIGRPVITANGSGVRLDFEIRPEARWDNGTPITANDVLFTYKAILNPKANTEHMRVYFELIDKVEIDSRNPKKFSVFTKEKYILIEEYSGYWVLPEYALDPNQVLRKYNIADFKNEVIQEVISKDNAMIRFTENFNSQKVAREKNSLIGSGAYQLEEWKTGSKISFIKKKNWWGRKCSDSFVRNFGQLDKLKFKIINDWSTATTAIKGKEIDVMKGVEFKVFNELKSEKRFTDNFTAHTPISLQYSYIGFNMSNPKLKDLNVRKALAHAVNKDQLINTLLYGLAVPTESMVGPSESYCNNNLKKFEYDLEESKKLLDEAGWKDSDGDGVRDKVVAGKLTKLELQYKYNAGNETRKNIGLIFKENLKKIGIELTIVNKEFTVFLDDLKKHDFEVCIGAWVGDPTVTDPKQIWHTSSSKSGSNYLYYGDASSDKLIEEIRQELNPTRRDQLYAQFQEKVHNDIPCIFLFAPLERIAISKKFSNAKAYPVRPGYDLGLWQVAK